MPASIVPGTRDDDPTTEQSVDPAGPVAMFPLSTVLFPGDSITLRVFEPRYREMVAHCMAGSRRFGVVLIARGSEVGGGDQRVAVGTMAHIEAAAASPDGRWALLVRGTRRIRTAQWLPDDPYPRAVVVDHPPNPPVPTVPTEDPFGAAQQALRRVHRLLTELGRGALAPGRIETAADEDDDLAAWKLCALAPFTALDRQQLLETSDTVDRMDLLCKLSDEMALDLERLLATGTG